MAFDFYGVRKPKRMDFREIAQNPLSTPANQGFSFYGQPAARTTPGFNADFASVARNPVASPPAGGSGLGAASTAMGIAAGGFDPVSAGLGIGSQIFSYLAGAGTRKRKKETYNALGGLSSQVGKLKGRLNPTDLYAKSVVGYAPQIQQFDEEMSRRYGFDSGVAGKYLARKLAEVFGALRPQLEESAAGYDLNTLTSAANIKSAQGQYA